jgi:tetratricopeptide (TPR) repeat protein
MTSMKTRHALGLVVFLVVACRSTPRGAERVSARAPEQGGAIEGLGHIDFPNSGPAAAQEAFVRGVLLLHSFEYEDAAEAFREAQKVAPDFALAYWGEAMTNCHPIWQEENRDGARAVLARLGATPAERAAKAGDERERGLLAAVEALFGEGTRAERARLYCDAMAALHARWPDDLELAAFHALAILGTATQGRDVPTYMRAAAAAEQVLERAPDHPGALHYAIHSFDDPTHAPLGLRMARRYGVVAAAAEHALHMPSHIYVALGMWEDSIAANVAAAAAADARRARKGLDVDARGFHSLAWLAYSYLQVGNMAEAGRLLADMRRDEQEKSSKRTRSHLVAMRAAQVVALQAWDQELASFEVALDGLEPATASAELYVRGRRALARGEVERARESLAAIAERRGPLETLAPASGTAQCCSTSGRSNYLPGRLAAQVMELELSGLIALQAGASEDGLARLAAAAEKEDAMGFDFGPPAVVEPAHELLGHVQLGLGHAAEAAREFEAALKRAPGRARSLQGLTTAKASVDPRSMAQASR